jgi:hypothetical protein
MCHAEKLRLPAGDLVVTGLGNKSVRPHAYLSAFIRIARDKNLDAERLEQLAAGRADLHHVAFSQRPMLVRKSIVGAAISGLKKVAKIRGNYAHRFGDAMPGRMATIESFAAGLSFWLDRPVPTPMPIGWAKVPDVRSFPYRDTFSYDGSGYGSPQALVLEADFLFGARCTIRGLSTRRWLREAKRSSWAPARAATGSTWTTAASCVQVTRNA